MNLSYDVVMTYLRPILIALALSVALNVTVFLLGGGNGLANSGPVTLRLVEGHQAVCTMSATLNQDNRKLGSTKTETTIKVNSDHLIMDITSTEENTVSATKNTLVTLKINLVNGVPTKVNEVIKFSINGIDLRTYTDLDTFIKIILIGNFPLYGITLSEGKNISHKELISNFFSTVEDGNTIKIEEWAFLTEKLNSESRTVIINHKSKLRFLNAMVVSSHVPWKIDLNTGLPISKNFSSSIRISGIKLTGESTESCSISKIKGYAKNLKPIFDQRIENKNIKANNVSLEDRLSEVASLLSKGLITEDEASEKRRGILGLENIVRVNPIVSSVEESYTLSCRANN